MTEHIDQVAFLDQGAPISDIMSTALVRIPSDGASALPRYEALRGTDRGRVFTNQVSPCRNSLFCTHGARALVPAHCRGPNGCGRPLSQLHARRAGPDGPDGPGVRAKSSVVAGYGHPLWLLASW